MCLEEGRGWGGEDGEEGEEARRGEGSSTPPQKDAEWPTRRGGGGGEGGEADPTICHSCPVSFFAPLSD